MTHVLVPFLEAPDELDEWYGEGIAEYCSATVPYAAGLYTPQQYLRIINEDASQYSTNARRLTPDRDIPASKWAGRNAWTLSYARGMLYFADLDAKLRRAGSPHTVLALIRRMNQLHAAGHKLTATTWVSVLRREVGEWAVRDWQAMVDGQLLCPVAGAFGPYFTTRSTQVGVFDLGFAQPISLQAGGHIQGLVADSPAARADLRDGDEIATTVNLFPIYSSIDRPLTLPVRRGDSLLYSSRNGLRIDNVKFSS